MSKLIYFSVGLLLALGLLYAQLPGTGADDPVETVALYGLCDNKTLICDKNLKLTCGTKLDPADIKDGKTTTGKMMWGRCMCEPGYFLEVQNNKILKKCYKPGYINISVTPAGAPLPLPVCSGIYGIILIFSFAALTSVFY